MNYDRTHFMSRTAMVVTTDQLLAESEIWGAKLPFPYWLYIQLEYNLFLRTKLVVMTSEGTALYVFSLLKLS